MKAARYYGVKDIRIENIDPPVPKDNQVLVKIEWCGICGSDLKNYSYGTASAAESGAVPTSASSSWNENPGGLGENEAGCVALMS